MDPRTAAGRAGEPRHPEIVHPEEGAVLLAETDTIVVRPEIRGGKTSRLLVDGRPMTDESFELGIGFHELRVIEPGRPAHAVTIEVDRRP